ncbi:AbrB family transcriptional regulator [Nocardioides mesophilus]|uniref:AbrB family transcriptional regulator n=1 Tax=Nocardioides mesophilus TaxID=433659 RepID=A0A7G9RG35_9ACTN|nr:AbrB family transcriptional regulator [Nocardioides mesophilus]QNN54560.1 AbrB family transcriptional regulator [Nocardioides mesophilus]
MLRRWLLLGVLVAASIGALTLAGAPAPYLLGALVGGLVTSMAAQAPDVPRSAGTLGQAVIGVSVGTLVTVELLDTFAEHGWVIALALAGTLLSSLAWGQVLRLQPGVTATTASFASIAGGASGVVATARDAGADEPVVATIQYLRVLVVLFTMPVVAGLIDPSASLTGGPQSGAGASWTAYAFTLIALGIGLVAVRYLSFPGGAVLLPMLVSVLLAGTGLFGDATVPTVLLNAGYVVIGVQVGVKFTPQTLRLIMRLLPLALIQVAGTILTCAAIGYVVSLTTGISPLDAYLATTPGGLYAVVAIALSTGADTGLVFSLQVLRLFAALLMVPLLARLTRPRPAEGEGEAEPV